MIHVLPALFDFLSPLEHNGAVPVFCKVQSRKHAGRPEPRHDRRGLQGNDAFGPERGRFLRRRPDILFRQVSGFIAELGINDPGKGHIMVSGVHGSAVNGPVFQIPVFQSQFFHQCMFDGPSVCVPCFHL